ncbi:response regulator, partial [Desulfobacterales bacterium HSG17]|nr:response regulator [Desulfobacterales bacterium HSG17]
NDENFVSKLITGIDKLGYNAKAVSTGRDGLNTIINHSFDLVFIEVFLPDGMGYDFIPEFREKLPGLKVVAMTANNSKKTELRVREHNVMSYMIKPFGNRELKIIIDHIEKTSGRVE